jgi:hypothetical protein
VTINCAQGTVPKAYLRGYAKELCQELCDRAICLGVGSCFYGFPLPLASSPTVLPVPVWFSLGLKKNRAKNYYKIIYCFIE